MSISLSFGETAATDVADGSVFASLELCVRFRCIVYWLFFAFLSSISTRFKREFRFVIP